MKDGFVRVAAATPDIRVADCEFNADQIIKAIKRAEESEAKVIVFPELCLTGYTCGDLFLQDTLLRGAVRQMDRIVRGTKGLDILAAVGMPFEKGSRLYNVVVMIQDGMVLGIVPKSNIPNYSEFYEARYFTGGNAGPEIIEFLEDEVYFGTNILFRCVDVPALVTAAEICEDLWVPQPPSTRHALAGALLVVNASASDETTGKDLYRRELVKSQSARLVCGYLYADAGEGESTTDLVFAGHDLIAENGTVLTESRRFQNGIIFTEIDLEKLSNERRRITTYPELNQEGYVMMEYSLPSVRGGEAEEGSGPEAVGALPALTLSRLIDKAPFVPDDRNERRKRCEEITGIQALGLKKRLMHLNASKAVVGISGGLDSTLALLVTKKAFEMCGLDLSGIIAVTMPCFGTTDRTYNNAVTLVKELGAALAEIPVRDAVTLHLQDIGHALDVHDVTYENAQARERTQVLMDVANMSNALVIGTGDMSELALGWATYNGDHMSMYGVNASVPKTLVRYLVSYFAEEAESDRLKEVLLDILDTPVSPELLPPREGEISQKTEDIVGPYELHDFFLYYIMRFGFSPRKVYRLAVTSFEGEYAPDIILKWLKNFYRRFFSQQFKRSCLPDGPKVGTVALSPRGDLRMPSDASARLWSKELEEL